MPGLIGRAIATAQKQVAVYGEPCSWISTPEPVTADATKPWVQTPTAAPQGVPVSILFVKGSSPFMQLMAGSDQEQSRQNGLMAAVGFTPKADDSVVRSDGTVLAIESIDALKPNGEIILWRLVFKA